MDTEIVTIELNDGWKIMSASPRITGLDVIEAEAVGTIERNGRQYRMWTPADHDPRGDRHTFPNRIVTEACGFCKHVPALRAGTHGKEGFGL